MNNPDATAAIAQQRRIQRHIVAGRERQIRQARLARTVSSPTATVRLHFPRLVSRRIATAVL